MRDRYARITRPFCASQENFGSAARARPGVDHFEKLRSVLVEANSEGSGLLVNLDVGEAGSVDAARFQIVDCVGELRDAGIGRGCECCGEQKRPPFHRITMTSVKDFLVSAGTCASGAG